MVKVAMGEQDLLNCPAIFPDERKQFLPLRARINDKSMLRSIINVEKAVFDRVGGGRNRRPLTPPYKRFRIRRFS